MSLGFCEKHQRWSDPVCVWCRIETLEQDLEWERARHAEDDSKARQNAEYKLAIAVEALKDCQVAVGYGHIDPMEWRRKLDVVLEKLK